MGKDDYCRFNFNDDFICTSHPTLASAGGQAPDSQNTNNSEAIAMGNTKILRM